MFEDRMARVRAAMADKGIDALLLSVGPDLPWLIGYEAMALERLTMLVVPRESQARLVIPAFEIPRVIERPEFTISGWSETEDPLSLVIDALDGRSNLAIGDHTWSRFLVGLSDRIPGAKWSTAGAVVGALRAVKDQAELAALQRAADGVDRVAAALQNGEIPLIGRTEAEVSDDIGRRVVAEGHRKVNFAIVASGPNAASPHHHASDRVIQPNEVVLCDFGGTTAEPDGGAGYCSDITRCVYTGVPPAEFAEAYETLFRAQAAGVAGAEVGRPAGEVDQIARRIMEDGRLGEWFIHRLGHGIGVEAHEDPYLVEGNTEPLVAGNAFSIEPGFYIPNKWGARLEDIVVSTDDGPLALNKADHHLATVEA